MDIESQPYEQRLINSSLNLPQLPKNAWDSPLQEIQMTLKIWIYSGNLNLVSRSNSVVDCFCWMWKVWLALCGNHTVAKAPSEVGQSKIATADTKWKKWDLEVDSMRRNETRGASKSPRFAMQTSSVCAVLSAATTTMLACWDLVGTTVPSVTLRCQSLQYTSDTCKFWREIGLCTVAMIWVRVARLGNVGLPYQRVDMIALGLELSNTSQHLWPSVMGWRLLCKCNWLQIEVTLLKMY